MARTHSTHSTAGSPTGLAGAPSLPAPTPDPTPVSLIPGGHVKGPIAFPEITGSNTFGGRRGRTYDGPHKPEDFIIPARSGSKSESLRIWVHIQPAYDRAVASVVNARLFPFKTPGDVFRLCIHWGLKHLEELEPCLSVTGQVEAMLDILRQEEAAVEFNEFLLRSSAVIGRHVREGAHAEARRLVLTLQDQVQKMPAGYWRTKYLETIRKEYGHLVEGGRDAAVLWLSEASDGRQEPAEGEQEPEALIRRAGR